MDQAPNCIPTEGWRSDSGQAYVETALVLPLFVFLMLGTLQLSLMHQAHVLTKYAAYKAVRAGSLHHAKKDVMETAALAVLVPMVSWLEGGLERVQPSPNGAAWVSKFEATRARQRSGPLKVAEVKICGPTKNTARLKGGLANEAKGGGDEVQFDAPFNPSATAWSDSERTKLRIEVTFNFRMVIPFANAMLYWMTRGQEDAQLLWLTRMGPEATSLVHDQRSERAAYDQMARNREGYVLPIRASYAMKMMSDLYPDGDANLELPETSECAVRWAKKGGGE